MNNYKYIIKASKCYDFQLKLIKLIQHNTRKLHMHERLIAFPPSIGGKRIIKGNHEKKSRQKFTQKQ